MREIALKAQGALRTHSIHHPTVVPSCGKVRPKEVGGNLGFGVCVLEIWGFGFTVLEASDA